MLKMDALSENELRGITGGRKGNNYRRYPMKKGETLEDVAKHFNITEAELIRVNNFSDLQLKKLHEGSIIMIPIEEK